MLLIQTFGLRTRERRRLPPVHLSGGVDDGPELSTLGWPEGLFV